MRKNVAGQFIGAEIISLNGNPFAGTVAVFVTKDDGVQAAASQNGGNATLIGNGLFRYSPSAAETNSEWIAFTFTGSGSIPVTVQVFTGLNVRWVGGTAVQVGDIHVSMVSMLDPRTGSLPIFVGEDHLNSIGRALTIDGIVDSLIDCDEARLTVKDEDGAKVIDDLIAVDIDDVERRCLFDFAKADSAELEDYLDDLKPLFFFCQGEYAGGELITLKRGPVLLLDTAETTVPT